MILTQPGNLDYVPQRIISLVPSQTELLFSLGLDQEVVGITKFCIHPEKWFTSKTRIGGTKNLNIDKINQLQPDFIVANKEENNKEQIETLAKKFPICVTDIKNFDDAINMINDIGLYTNRTSLATEIIKNIKQSFSQINPFPQPNKKVVYLIWKHPYMTIGNDTFISDLIKKIGFTNCFQNSTRYPHITINDIFHHNPDYIFLSSEPYPFKDQDIEEFKALFPKCKILLVDGEMFSWYGSRLLKAASYFNLLLKKC